MAKEIKMAIIGCGGISAFAHIPELLNEDNVEIVALCDAKKVRADMLKNKYRLICKIYQDVDRMLKESPEIDAVIVSTNPKNTADIAKKVIGRGKHALIQKPLIYNEDFKKYFKQVKAGQQIMALPYIESLDIFGKIKAMIANGKLGDIQFARIRTSIIGPEDYYADVKAFYGEKTKKNVYYDSNYADCRGSLSDMGVYALSLYHYLFGEAKLKACVLSDKKFEKSAVIVLASGRKSPYIPPIASIESGWNQANGIELLSIMGNKGFLCLTTDGKLQIETEHDNEIQETIEGNRIKLLPISPYHAQGKWIQMIYDHHSQNQFENSLERCIWVSKIMDEVYKTANEKA